MLPALGYHLCITLECHCQGKATFDNILHGAKLTLPTSSTNWVPFVLKIDAACDLHTDATHVAIKNILAAAIAITVHLG